MILNFICLRRPTLEHCRHKIFNADWTIDGEQQPKSLFKIIKNTFRKNADHVLSAYKDNAAVMTGSKAGRFFPSADTQEYGYNHEDIHVLMKWKLITTQQPFRHSLVLPLVLVVKFVTKVPQVWAPNPKLA